MTMAAGGSTTFGEAIKVCFNKYADFEGCAPRPEFWWWVLFTFIAASVLQSVSYSLSAAFSLATFLPSIAVTARRLLDTIWCAEPGKANRYGSREPQAPNSV